jgi:signal transduction histidine kinase
VPVDLSAYRIVQEALTNVMKHAGAGATAEIVLNYRETALDLCVGDDGRSSGKPATGNGINGMRERVRLLGGTFTAGVRAVGGFEVRATLPIREHRA